MFGDTRSLRLGCSLFEIVGYLSLIISVGSLLSLLGVDSLTFSQHMHIGSGISALITLAWVYLLFADLKGFYRGWIIFAAASGMVGPALMTIKPHLVTTLLSSALMPVVVILERLIRLRWLIVGSERMLSPQITRLLKLAFVLYLVSQLLTFFGVLLTLSKGFKFFILISQILDIFTLALGILAFHKIRGHHVNKTFSSPTANNEKTFKTATSFGIAATCLSLALNIHSRQPETIGKFSGGLINGSLKQASLWSRESVYGKVNQSAKTREDTENACVKGDLNLCIIRGWIAAYDDQKIALSWFSKACRKNFLHGCGHAIGISQPPHDWIKKACSFGDERQCAIYATGLSREGDTEQAREFFRKGCVDVSITNHCKNADPYEPLFSDSERRDLLDKRKQKSELSYEMGKVAATVWRYREKNKRRPSDFKVLLDQHLLNASLPFSEGSFIDPWGNKIIYTKHVLSDHLISPGPDKKVGTDDDIEAWTPFESIYPLYTDKPVAKKRSHN